MDLTDLITHVFCLCDDDLQGKKLRHGGFSPKLHDSEVLAIEVVGELLGIDTNAELHRHFRRHYASLFPLLQEVHRTTFLRQAANLWAVKHHLWQHLLSSVRRDPELSILDSLPVPICRFARAKRCRLFGALAGYGKDSMLRMGSFYGMRLHMRITWPGVITAFELAPANYTDITAAAYLTEYTFGYLLGDRGYWSKEWHQQEREKGLTVLAPFQTKKHEKTPWPFWLTLKRRRVETVFSPLVGRFRAKRTWARDPWHLVPRWLRKVLAHTMAVLLCQRNQLPPLRFSELLCA